MSTDVSSTDLTRQKRQRRPRQDPDFLFENSGQKMKMDLKKSRRELKDDGRISTEDLYEPGDVVWSKLGKFPWWPALIFKNDAEGGNHTRNLIWNGTMKRQYFVYFYGNHLQYTWSSTRSLIKYAGLSDFIEQAETAVQQASMKSEKNRLANRYELKVSPKKRRQWDEAIALADQALLSTKAERIEQFQRHFQSIFLKKKKNRRRKVDINNENQSANIGKRQRITTEIDSNHVRKLNSAVELDSIASTVPPPLSNFEQKQIVESLIHHENSSTITLEQGKSLAKAKATEIIFQNYHRQVFNLSDEWFYDSILLKYPSVVFQYRSWFEHVSADVIPNDDDPMAVRQWLVSLMIRAKLQFDQQTKMIESRPPS